MDQAVQPTGSKARIYAWLKIALCIAVYVGLWQGIRLTTPDHTQAVARVLGLTAALLIVALVAIFNPFKR